MSPTNCTAILNSSAGPIPSEIGDLTELTELRLYSNQLSGEILYDIVPECHTKIPSNDMSRTNCTAMLNSSAGPIPSEIGDLTELTVLKLHSNQLSGKILYDIVSESRTKIPSNDQSQILIFSFFQVQFLQKLGSWRHWQDWIWTSTACRVSYIHERLTEMSPTNCTAILNSSAGPIPSEIGALTALTYLDLYSNQLSGKICTTLYQNPIQKIHWTTSHKY